MAPWRAHTTADDDRPAMTFKPLAPPRDVADVLIVLVVLPLQFAVLFGLPAVAAWLAFESVFAAITVVVVLYLGFASFAVWSLTTSTEGLRFDRRFGTPKFLRWEEIESIEVAPRKELVVRGWLWPLFPSRDLSPSMTSSGHYRIRWRGGDRYFVPEDAAGFEAQVRGHLRNCR